MREAGRCGIEGKIFVWIAVGGVVDSGPAIVLGTSEGVFDPFVSVSCRVRREEGSPVQFESSRAQAMDAWNLGSV